MSSYNKTIGLIERRLNITEKIHRNPNHGSAKAEVVSENLLQTYREQKCDFKHTTTTVLEKQEVKIVTCNL